MEEPFTGLMSVGGKITLEVSFSIKTARIPNSERERERERASHWLKWNNASIPLFNFDFFSPHFLLPLCSDSLLGYIPFDEKYKFVNE